MIALSPANLRPPWGNRLVRSLLWGPDEPCARLQNPSPAASFPTESAAPFGVRILYAVGDGIGASTCEYPFLGLPRPLLAFRETPAPLVPRRVRNPALKRVASTPSHRPLRSEQKPAARPRRQSQSFGQALSWTTIMIALSLSLGTAIIRD